MMTTITYIIDRDDEDIEIQITARVLPGTPARTNCLPEDCYPSEAGSVDILRIEADGEPWEGTLTEEETDAVLEYLNEHEDYLDEPDFDECDDYDADDDADDYEVAS
jgi:hypothetical protein